MSEEKVCVDSNITVDTDREIIITDKCNSDIVDKKTNDDDDIVDPNTLQINTTAKPQKQVRTRGGRVIFLSARSNNNQKHIRTRGIFFLVLYKENILIFIFFQQYR